MEAPIGVILRVLVAIAGIACLWPGSYLVNGVGALAVLALLVLNIRGAKDRGDIPAAI